MKKNEITVGGKYVAKISGKLTTVRVDAIREVDGYTTGQSYWARTSPTQTRYDVTNLTTGRKTTFRSAAKFRSVVAEKPWMWTCSGCAINPMETSICRKCGKERAATVSCA